MPEVQRGDGYGSQGGTRLRRCAAQGLGGGNLDEGPHEILELVEGDVLIYAAVTMIGNLGIEYK